MDWTPQGKALAGDFVMRRDPGDNQSLLNDCHEVAREYPVIRAAFERGFPAPDALWLDTSPLVTCLHAASTSCIVCGLVGPTAL